MIWYHLPFILATLVLVILRLTGTVKWSWWMVFIPTYIHITLVVLGTALVLYIIRSANN